jgi:hypothetical protein
VLTKGKLPTAAWIEVVTTAHSVGLRSSSTMMYGHVDTPAHWVAHLKLLARLQDERAVLDLRRRRRGATQQAEASRDLDAAVPAVADPHPHRLRAHRVVGDEPRAAQGRHRAAGALALDAVGLDTELRDPDPVAPGEPGLRIRVVRGHREVVHAAADEVREQRPAGDLDVR